jgi:hypothetical protein
MDRLPLREQRWQRIQSRIDQAATILQRHGALVAKQGRKTPEWCIRYSESVEGRRRQRSIYIGTDPILVDRAKRLLEHYRQLDRWDRELEAAAGSLRRLVARLKRPYRSDRKLSCAQGAIPPERRTFIERGG